MKFIGEGSFGKVYLGHHHRLCSLRVIKEIDLSECSEEYVMEEVKALRRLRGRNNIVQLSEAFEVRNIQGIARSLAQQRRRVSVASPYVVAVLGIVHLQLSLNALLIRVLLSAYRMAAVCTS